MPEDATLQLRIYCVCGQKMKVTDALFGRPGKCIACRQKIRIPRRDEVPAGVTEIHLKDHPEFLRKSSRKPDEPPSAEKLPIARKEKKPPRVEDGTETLREPVADEPATASEPLPGPTIPEPRAAGESESEEHEDKKKRASGKREKTISIALDVLDPIRELCSLRKKVETSLSGLDESADDATAIAEAEGHLARIRAVRADINEQLRQSLMETAIELASTQEKISETLLAARVGESSLEEYQSAIYKLRERRDRLERRQQNLRGWLSVEDPHAAGGFVDVPITNVPEEGAHVSIPSDAEEPGPLVNRHAAALREAFAHRAEAERKLAELKRMEAEGAATGGDLSHAEANALGDRNRYDAQVAFRRERLKQCAKDYGNDLETYKAQLELGRGRLQVDEIRRPEFDALEKKLRRVRADAMKARSLAERTLAANSAHDVPRPRGSFLDRIKSRPTDAANRVELWSAWGAVAALVLSAFLPSVGKTSLVGAFMEFRGVENTPTWAFVVPLLAAVAVLLAMRVLARPLRGALLTALWTAGTLAGVYLVHEAAYGMDPMSARFRTGTIWPLRPGMILLVLGNIGVLASIFLTYVPIRQRRALPFGAIAAVAVIALGIATDLGGYFRAEPVVAVEVAQAARTSDAQETATTITVSNPGGRALYLVIHRSLAKDAYVFLLQEKIGANSWADAVAENLMNAPGQNYNRVAPGASAGVRVALPPGEYRALLVSGSGKDEIVESFRVGATPPPPGKQVNGVSEEGSDAVD